MKFNGKSQLNDGTESENTSIHLVTNVKRGNIPDKIEHVGEDMNDRSLTELERGLMQMELAEGGDEDRHNRESKF